MNKLVKPQKQSYTGDDAQVVAYSLACELAAILCPGLAIGLLGFGVAPALVALAVSCSILTVLCGLL